MPKSLTDPSTQQWRKFFVFCRPFDTCELVKKTISVIALLFAPFSQAAKDWSQPRDIHLSQTQELRWKCVAFNVKHPHPDGEGNSVWIYILLALSSLLRESQTARPNTWKHSSRSQRSSGRNVWPISLVVVLVGQVIYMKAGNVLVLFGAPYYDIGGRFQSSFGSPTYQ